jgi:hypothetical protein
MDWLQAASTGLQMPSNALWAMENTWGGKSPVEADADRLAWA